MNLTKKIIGIAVTTAVTFISPNVARSSPGYSPQIYVNSCYAPPGSPAGLIICSFSVNYSQYQYRIYCPNRTVRNITNGSWGQARNVFAEDNFQFGGQGILTRVVNDVCR